MFTMGQLSITYANKNADAAIGTIERTWRAMDANEVKSVVNALSSLVQNLVGSDVTPFIVVVSAESSVTVSHNFDRSPLLRVVNSSGVEVSVVSTDVDSNTTTINFGETFSGTVIAI